MLDTHKAEAALGARCQVGLRDTLQRAYAWYQALPEPQRAPKIGPTESRVRAA